MIKKIFLFVLTVFVLCMLTGCENSLLDRSLIFSTHTTAGLEVAIGGPAETAVSPVKLIIGYKRSEGVLNPVYDREYISTANSKDSGKQDKYRKEAYSVVAKLFGEAKASSGSQAEGAMGVSQWFATGKAASIIARNEGIAAAVTGNTGIAEALAKMPARTERLKGLNEDYALIVVGQIYNALDVLQKDDPKAGEHIQELEKYASLILPRSFTKYQMGVGAQQDRLLEKTELSTSGFKGLIEFIEAMKVSMNTLSNVLAKSTFTLQKVTAPPAEPELITVNNGDEEHDRLSKDLLLIDKKLSAIRKSFTNDKAVVDAVNYYLHIITGNK